MKTVIYSDLENDREERKTLIGRVVQVLDTWREPVQNSNFGKVGELRENCGHWPRKRKRVIEFHSGSPLVLAGLFFGPARRLFF